MKWEINKIIKILAAFLPVIIAALGGALIVFSGYDDAPGGVLLGLVIIVAAGVISLRARS